MHDFSVVLFSYCILRCHESAIAKTQRKNDHKSAEKRCEIFMHSRKKKPRNYKVEQKRKIMIIMHTRRFMYTCLLSQTSVADFDQN